MVRVFFDYAQDWRVRLLVLVVSAQSTKTQNLMNLLAWSVANDPCTCMWIMASKDNAEEFLKKRLRPHFESSPGLEALWPKDRDRVSQRLVMFDAMNLLIRGSNSKIGLQSDPVRRIFCDERREWGAGAIGMVRKRLVTFHDSQEISCGTAGNEYDELHTDYNRGSQTVFVWPCLKCGFEQPFRFGREPTPFWPEPRKKGGVVWETNGTTKPGGVWNYDEVRKTVGYECENCGHIYRNEDKFALVKSIKPMHRNPSALPSAVSLHWNALYMPWPDCSWDTIVIEFLRAKAATKRGDLAPLKTFVTETCGEPWRVPTQKIDAAQLMERRGRYKHGEKWEPSFREERFISLITVDVQSGHLIVVMRQYRKGGASRLIHAGRLGDFDQLAKFQQEHKVQPQCVFIDRSYLPRDVDRACLRWRYHPMMGDEAEEFTIVRKEPGADKASSIKSPWKPVRYDPHEGTGEQGKTELRRFHWSNPHYMESLYFYRMAGAEPLWEIPLDVPDEYVKQIMAYERESIQDADGVVTYSWVHHGRRRDYADCELMQLAAADICYITQSQQLNQ